MNIDDVINALQYIIHERDMQSFKVRFIHFYEKNDKVAINGLFDEIFYSHREQVWVKIDREQIFAQQAYRYLSGIEGVSIDSRVVFGLEKKETEKS